MFGLVYELEEIVFEREERDEVCGLVRFWKLIVVECWDIFCSLPCGFHYNWWRLGFVLVFFESI